MFLKTGGQKAEAEKHAVHKECYTMPPKEILKRQNMASF